MTGGGLKKCMPITSSGRPVAVASCTIGNDEVFEASTTSGRTIPSSLRKTSILESRSSVAASITRSQPVSASSSVAPEIRPSTTGASARSIFPCSRALFTEPSMRPRPASTSS